MDGEGAGGDLNRLLQSIKSSEVVECRTELIEQLGELTLTDKSDSTILVESLATFWEESTCVDVSQCMLNKSVLHVAVKHLEKGVPECLQGLLSLATKASIWCVQHFSMSLTSMEDSQEEHSGVFCQVILDMLGFSSACFSVLIGSPVLGQTAFAIAVENFISKQLNLAKVAIAEIKVIHSVASEVLKFVQEVLNSAVRLCRAYHQALNSVSCGIRSQTDGGSMDDETVDNVNHVANLTTCTIDYLYELGIFAATGGGSLVTILNVSWKGVVTLLQLNKGDAASKVNITDILLTLVSLATETLRCAAECWSLTRKENISPMEAKRTFLPVKFYLINAVRILSQYPCQAFTIFKELTLFALMISTFGILLSNEAHLKASSEALTELLEPTSNLLLHTLLNSFDVNEESKFQILEWLFTDFDSSSSINPETAEKNATNSMSTIFSVTCDAMPRSRLLLLGRVVLFLNLLRSSPDLAEDARLGISRKLGWLFDCLIDEDVYSTILNLQIPVLYGSGSGLKLVWKPMFLSVLHVVKTFMVVVSSSSAWEEVETFLLENLLHPHVFLRETVLEFWCFLARHADVDMVNDVIDKLCLLSKTLVSSESVLMPDSALRKMARSICVLLSYAPQLVIDRVYSSILNDDRSPLSSVMYISLLIEGFPLNLLSDKMKKLATQRIITGYHSFMETNHKKLRTDNFSSSSWSSVLGGPIYALSSALRCLRISSSDIDAKTLKFVLSLIHGYRCSTDRLKDTYCDILNQTLAIISNMTHLYACVEIGDVILELQTLFSMRSEAADARLYKCKPDLALFMAGVGDMKIVKAEGSPMVPALCDIYHMLLRERHWAFVHSAISAFGYFAARTNCDHLYRFVPNDAALSFDIETGSKTNEERFMTEMRVFLEKEVALRVVAPCTEQLALLAGEALILKELVEKSLIISPDESIPDSMEIDEENQKNKKRKLPDEISEGMALMHSGLKIIGDGLSQWRHQNSDTMEFQSFSTHLSRLEDVLSHLANFAETR